MHRRNWLRWHLVDATGTKASSLHYQLPPPIPAASTSITLTPSPEDPLWALPQARLPLTNPVLRLQVSQVEETSLPSPGPRCSCCGKQPATHPIATPAEACRGLSWPLPGRGCPAPWGCGATSRAQPVSAWTWWNMKLPLSRPCPQREFRRGRLPAPAGLTASGPQSLVPRLGWCLASATPKAHGDCLVTLFPLKARRRLVGGEGWSRPGEGAKQQDLGESLGF